MRYPGPIREGLKDLKMDGYTRPLRPGEKYIIFKRFDRAVIQDLPR
jgi:hypothetical protein